MLENIFKTITAIFGASVTYLFGEWSILLQMLLTLVLVDYSTGLLASGYEGKLSSKVGFKGILKKVMIFAMVAVAHAIDSVLGENHFFRDATIFFYLANEVLSIIENTGRMGIPIPSVLSKAVDVLKDKSNEKGESK